MHVQNNITQFRKQLPYQLSYEVVKDAGQYGLQLLYLKQKDTFLITIPKS